MAGVFVVRWMGVAAIAAVSVVATWIGLSASWSDPDAAWPLFLTFAASLPSVAGVVMGSWLWWAGSGWPPNRFDRACVAFAAGTLAALAVSTFALALIDIGTPVERWSECGPFRAVCATFVGLHVANMTVVLTLGLVFPALLPFCVAGLSMLLPAQVAPGRARMGLAVFAVALATGVAIVAGLAIGEA